MSNVIDLTAKRKELSIKNQLVRMGREPLYESHMKGTNYRNDFNTRLKDSLDKINALMVSLKEMESNK